jgi:uncharacterized protein
VVDLAAPSVAEFVKTALQNPVNRALGERLPALRLPQAYLVAGCLVQAVWNELARQPASAGVSDYDVFYYDDSDLSWEAEDGVIRRVRDVAADLNVRLDVKNQARVHLWYEQRFGVAGPVLRGARDGIDRFPVACTCVGLELANRELYAPFGLEELYDGLLRPNPNNANAAVFSAKAESYRARWPWLRITPLA